MMHGNTKIKYERSVVIDNKSVKCPLPMSVAVQLGLRLLDCWDGGFEYF